MRRVAAVSALALLASACDGTVTAGPVLPDTVMVIVGTPAPPAVYSGSRGLVVDTRQLFHRGYFPSEVTVSFPAYARLGATLQVDPLTNLAILAIENDSLTTAELTAFQAGAVQVRIAARGIPPLGSAMVELASFTGPRTVDASNKTVALDSDTLATIVSPLRLNPNTPYLIVPDRAAGDGLVITGYDYVPTGGTATRSGRFDAKPWPFAYAADAGVSKRQGFYFIPVVGQPNTYTIRYDGPLPTWGSGSRFLEVDFSGGRYDALNVEVSPASSSYGTAQFLIRPAIGGRVAIEALGFGNGAYLCPPEARSASLDGANLGIYNTDHESLWRATCGPGSLFRLIPPEIEWSIEPGITAFNQPILPAARIALASESTILNCSAASVDEMIGRTQSRTTTTTSSTSESFQLVSETVAGRTWINKLDVEVKYVPSSATGGLTGGVNFSHSDQMDSTYTTRAMWDTTTVRSSSTSETVEIARSRTVRVPPYSGIAVADFVRTVEGLVVPWTQFQTISGRVRGTGQRLSGLEIVSILHANRTRALPVTIGADFVEFSIRGHVAIDNLYQNETRVRDIANACTTG